MGTYWKRWVALVIFAVVLVTAFIQLGDWQLRRLAEKRARNATIVAQQQEPVASFDEVFGREITADKQYRKVRVEGTFDPAHQVQVRYRTNNGDTGYEVVVPLQTASGGWVLVDRGFAPRPSNGPLPAASAIPAPPTGPVTVEGYVSADEPGPQNAIVPTEGSTRLVNPAAIATWSGRPLVDGYLNATSITPAPSDGLVPVALPELSEGPHLSYAIQWFCFAAIGIGGTFILIGKDAREIVTGRRKRRTKAADDVAADGAVDSTGDDSAELTGARDAGATSTDGADADRTATSGTVTGRPATDRAAPPAVGRPVSDTTR
ncbi:SURF1 family protein [Raineyella sp.]|uniref:SURF1 family cytochrome oxidase biogenesis protein n=1 Tax=Raineyella sp. TaxID=1911550 RepID=UPI002B1EE112|nr:SURF1 family protein [Raineyella sp.]MEA5154191.1 SURF1 family protein [Raineyella sp.]